ncbi:MAG: hypothetical protein QOJ99_4538 [Bryobacterales bacterium]|nr:hypothetical protein [Bryobacterales bacterium]
MKQRTTFSLRKATAVAALCLGLTVIGYAKNFPFTASSLVPAARGEVEFNEDKNGNNKVKIKAEHMALPSNLTPPRSAYVVWFQERDGNPAIQGVLKVNNKDLKAEFETTTPIKNFTVLVTAENETSPASPTGPEILRATVQQ